MITIYFIHIITPTWLPIIFITYEIYFNALEDWH